MAISKRRAMVKHANGASFYFYNRKLPVEHIIIKEANKTTVIVFLRFRAVSGVESS